MILPDAAVQAAANVDYILLWWLFIKNFMFCTVNAIMFDIKDYAHDSNKQLTNCSVKSLHVQNMEGVHLAL